MLKISPPSRAKRCSLHLVVIYGPQQMYLGGCSVSFCDLGKNSNKHVWCIYMFLLIIKWLGPSSYKLFDAQCCSQSSSHDIGFPSFNLGTITLGTVCNDQKTQKQTHEELLEVSAMMASSNIQSLDVRKFSPLGLGAAGLSLRNAADMMLDEDWESAMGELEALIFSKFGGFLQWWGKTYFENYCSKVWCIEMLVLWLRCEVAAASSEGFLPPLYMQGLVAARFHELSDLLLYCVYILAFVGGCCF